MTLPNWLPRFLPPLFGFPWEKLPATNGGAGASYKFNVGDRVITSDGIHGTITDRDIPTRDGIPQTPMYNIRDESGGWVNWYTENDLRLE